MRRAAGSPPFSVGPPTLTLVEFTREAGIDVLVMGRIQRRGLQRYVGNTTEHLLYQMPGSVLAIRPETT